jgi:tetratricopeptide (TPR) repeat protein
MSKRLAWVLPLFLPAVLSAQNIPEKFENLKVLPKDISRNDLTAIMRGFTAGLGVRCEHCHVPEEGGAAPAVAAAAPGGRGGQERMNYKADDKTEKETARAMMKMTQALNDEDLGQLNKRREPNVEVNCYTCHRGMPFPQTISDALLDAYRKQGVQGAIARYKDLKTRYETAGMLDFRPEALTAFTRTLAQDSTRRVDAVTIQKLNLELNPQSANAHFGLGELLLAGGDKPAALTAFKKTLELQPNNRQAQQRIRELGG